MPIPRPSSPASPASLVSLTAALLLSFGMAGCLLGKADDPGYVLHLTLDDSLFRYDSINVVIADPVNPEIVIEPVYSGILPASRSIPAITLKRARDPFLVRVRGIRGEGQVGLETHIHYQGGVKRVVHVPKPPLTPINWLGRLSASPGTLAPPLSINNLAYTVTPAEGAASVTLDMMIAYSKAVLRVNGEIIPTGRLTRPFPTSSAGSMVSIQVTDLDATLAYTVSILPPPPPKPRIAQLSLAPSSVVLAPAFSPDVLAYTVSVPANVKDVSLTATVTMREEITLDVNGARWFSGVPGTITLDAPGDSKVVTVIVSHKNESRTYTLYFARAK
ncbi:MAG TPA: cadherin-like beta sandwich domain-containing protein [Fibrobacteria bacterium]|nr:cadherin-like beta sandwich domain-containing protein [Fibrobacteria bacterium]